MSLNIKIWNEPDKVMMKQFLQNEARMYNHAHQPPQTIEEWNYLRDFLEIRIKQCLRIESKYDDIPLNTQIHDEFVMDGYSVRNITYLSCSGVMVTANLYIPEGEDPFPGVFRIPGHALDGKIDPDVHSVGIILAKSGYVVLIPDAFGSGERGTLPGEFEYHGYGIGGSLFSLNKPLAGLQVLDNIRAIDLLCGMDIVDSDKIGVTGSSGGGNQTMWLSAIDRRIKAVIPVVSVGTFESYITSENCVCECCPDGLTFMEEWGVLSMIAPAALLMLNSMVDQEAFHPRQMIKSYRNARKIYELMGIAPKIAYQVFPEPHAYTPEMRRWALGWFNYWLKGRGSGEPCIEPEFEVIPKDKLLCFKGKKRHKTVLSILDFAKKETESQKQSFLKKNNITIKSMCRTMLDITRVKPDLPESKSVKYWERKEKGNICLGLSVDSEAGISLPMIIIRRKDKDWSQHIIIHADLCGKETICKNEMLVDRVDEKTGIVAVDLRNTGETCWEDIHKPWLPDDLYMPQYHNTIRSCLWLGRTIIGDWATDLIAVCRFFLRRGTERFTINAYSEVGLSALITALVISEVNKAILINCPGSLGVIDDFNHYSMTACVPGIVENGDVSGLIACCPCDVVLKNPVKTSGVAYTLPEKDALLTEIISIQKKLKGFSGKSVSIMED